MSLQPYPLTMQTGMTRLHGHLFIAPEKLYFVCSKKGGAWAAAIGQGLGGLVGAAIAAAGSGGPGETPDVTPETLEQAVVENDGSLVLEPADIDEIKHTIWWRMMKYNGKKYGFPNGLAKDLKAALGSWAQTNEVKTKGLVKK
jgi:hypothetical protein